MPIREKGRTLLKEFRDRRIWRAEEKRREREVDIDIEIRRK